MGSSASLGALLWFVLILALIPLALWLLKRSGRVPGLMTATPGAMKVIQTLTVGPQQRLLTVEVGSGSERRWLVLGVTPQQIRTLHTLEHPPVVESPVPAPLPSWLARWQPQPGASAPAVAPGDERDVR